MGILRVTESTFSAKAEGKRMSFRTFYSDYETEIWFAILLLAAVIASDCFAGLIPADLYENGISQILNGCVATVSLAGAWLVARHHKDIRARKVWAGVLLVWAVLATLLLMRLIVYNSERSDVGLISLRGCELVVGNIYAWLLLLYPAEVLRPGSLTLKRTVLHMLPVFIIAALNYWLPIDLRWMLAIYPVMLVFFLTSHIRAYRRWCEENYSTMDDIDEQWIWRYLTMFLISGGQYIVLSFSTTQAHLFTQQWLLLLMLAYSTEQIVFRADPWTMMRSTRHKEEQTVAKPEASGEEDGDAGEWSSYKAALEQWMEREKPYCNPEFRLLDLCEVLPLNRTYLSQFINTEYGCSFYQLVTNYRIEEAKRLMDENPEMKLQDISEQCGFSSPVVFSRIFSRETGMTPREWNTKLDNS